MKIRYRLAFAWRIEWVEKLRKIGLSVSPPVLDPGNGGVAITCVEEGHPGWSEACDLVRSWNGTILHTTEFSAKDVAGAEYCALSPTHYDGYPQPDDDFGYIETTYDVRDYCRECGVGLRQVAPFRMRKSLKWGRNSFMQLHWVRSEFFMKREAWSERLEPLGVLARPVEDVKGRVIEDVVQIRVDDHAEIDLDEVDGVTCEVCGRTYYSPISRGYFPSPVGVKGEVAFRTRQFFGTGHNGFNEIIVASSVATAIVTGSLKGVKLWPCAPVDA